MRPAPARTFSSTTPAAPPPGDFREWDREVWIKALPGPFETDRLRANLKINAQKSGKSEEEMRRIRAESNPAGRFGTVEEFGDACAYLCSAQGGFITGQNLLLDGGAYPGTFG